MLLVCWLIAALYQLLLVAGPASAGKLSDNLEWPTGLKIDARVAGATSKNHEDNGWSPYPRNSSVENENVPVLVLFCPPKYSGKGKVSECNHIRWWIEEYHRRLIGVTKNQDYKFLYTNDWNLTDAFQDQAPVSSKFPALLYSLYGTVYLYRGNSSNEAKVINWYDGLQKQTRVVLVNASNVDEFMDRLEPAADCSNKSKSLIVLYSAPRQQCSQLPWLDHLSMALQRHNLLVFALTINSNDDQSSSESELVQTSESELKLNLYHRLCYLSTWTMEDCRTVFLVQHGRYKELSKQPLTPTVLRDFALTIDGCREEEGKALPVKLCRDIFDRPFGGADSAWCATGERLSDIAVTYHLGEDMIRRKMSLVGHIVIGATGGVAVIALATSIFWGLNSSSFAKQ